MRNVRFSVQEVKSFQQVLHGRFCQLFGEWARFAAWSLERKQCGLKRQVDQTLVDVAANAFETEDIDGMTDVLGSRV